jgi:hypothetical protein
LRLQGDDLQAGLKHDPNSEELKEGIRRTIEAMSKVWLCSTCCILSYQFWELQVAWFARFHA